MTQNFSLVFFPFPSRLLVLFCASFKSSFRWLFINETIKEVRKTEKRARGTDRDRFYFPMCPTLWPKPRSASESEGQMSLSTILLLWNHHHLTPSGYPPENKCMVMICLVDPELRPSLLVGSQSICLHFCCQPSVTGQRINIISWYF